MVQIWVRAYLRPITSRGFLKLFMSPRKGNWVETSRNASLLVFPLLSLSVLVVVYNLYVLDLSQAYVVDVASLAMSAFLRITALWGGQQGSILFWAWIMS